MGWKEILLSRTGIEVLIKAVAQAISTYAMSYFQLPDDLCNELSSIVRKFWLSKGMHWISWDKLCLPKQKGGLGI